MTTEFVVRFFEDTPFPPFTIITVDGRELNVKHPEHALFSRRAEVIYFFYPDHRVEVIDILHVVSLRTMEPADIATFSQ